LHGKYAHSVQRENKHFLKERIMKNTISLVLILSLGLVTDVTNADFTFCTPTNLGPTINSSGKDFIGSISPDGLSLYFASARPGGYGGGDIWVTTRSTTDDDWGAPLNLGPTVNSPYSDGLASISADGLSLYFESNRPGGSGNWDVWVTTRATTDDDWGTPVNLGPTVNSSYVDSAPSISADGLALFFSDYVNGPFRPGSVGMSDLWVTTRPTKDDPWGEPVNLGSTVNSSFNDGAPCISPDGRALFFASKRTGEYEAIDIWVTTRPTIDDDWTTPVNVGPTVNTSAWDVPASISADGSTLFFWSNRPGGVGDFDIWQAPIIPIVDLNGDGIVDSADMCKIVDHWGTDESLCDIGPMPWGDGIVDVQDLIVLAEHLFEEVPRTGR